VPVEESSADCCSGVEVEEASVSTSFSTLSMMAVEVRQVWEPADWTRLAATWGRSLYQAFSSLVLEMFRRLVKDVS
jgi:hypothetical protein